MLTPLNHCAAQQARCLRNQRCLRLWAMATIIFVGPAAIGCWYRDEAGQPVDAKAPLAAAVADTVPAAAQDAARTADRIERVVPAAAFLSLATDDAAATAEQFQRVPLGGALRSEAWKPYFAAVEESHTGSALHLRPWFGIDWSDLAELPVPVCLCTFADAKQQPATALIIDVRRQPDAAQDLPERAAAYFQSRRARLIEEKAAEGKRVVYSLDGGARETICLSRVDRVAFITSRGGADALAAFWAAKERAALADVPEYQQVQKQAGDVLGKPGLVRWWVRPLDLVRSVPKPPAEGKRGRRDWVATAQRLGIAGVKGIGGSIRPAGSDAASLEIPLAVVAQRPYQGALQMASLQAGPWRDPPAWASRSVASWTVMDRDVEPWFEGFGAAFDELAKDPGAFRDFLDGLKAEADGPRIDVRREIVARLLPGMAVVSDFDGERPAWNPAGRRDLIMLDVKEAAELEKVFRRWFAADVEDMRVRQEIVGEHPLWAAKPGRALFIDTGGDPELRITAMAVTKDALLLATDEPWLRTVLEKKTPDMPLAKDERYLAASKYLQAHETKMTSLRSFAHGSAVWQMPYEALRGGQPGDEGDAGRALLELLLFGASEGTPAALTGTLPDWNAVSPSLGTSAVSLRVLPSGLAGIVGILPATPPNGGVNRP